MAQLNPYLNFDGNCREAMNFYKDIFGGVLNLQKVNESPKMAAMMPPKMGESILHSQLHSGEMMLMGSDLNREKRVDGNTVQLCINCKTEDELNRFFSGLSAGGIVTEPIADMPWGAKYGSLIDKYQKHWIFNFQKS